MHLHTLRTRSATSHWVVQAVEFALETEAPSLCASRA